MRHPLFVVAFGMLLSLGALNAQSPATPWPPPGVVAPADVDTPPAVLKRVPAGYTPEAMSAGITGSVLLQCVVQADGSVGEVRVLQSLDAVHGLDQAATAALKQWQFKPATKDGKPVATLARVQLSFALRKEDASPVFSWPQAFESTPVAGAWNSDDIVVGDLQFHIEYPEGWALRRAPMPGYILEVTNATIGARLAIRARTPATVSFERPFDPMTLKTIAHQQGDTATGKATPEDRGFGQTNAGGRLWVWSEWYIHTADQKSLPESFRTMASGVIEGTSAWLFQTAAEGQAIDVVSTVMMPATATDDERVQRRNGAAAQFGAMLRRMTIKPKQP